MRVPRKPGLISRIEELSRPRLPVVATPLGSGGGSVNHGIVTVLPASPSVGDTCYFIANKTNGVIWHLVYDGEGTYPWKKIGGAPLRARADTLREVKNAGYVSLPTDPMSIAVPLKGDYDITIEANILPVAGGSGAAGIGRISYAVGATAAANEWAASNQQNTGTGAAGDQQISVSKKTPWTGLAAGTSVQEKATSGSASTASDILDRRLWIDPVRVG